MYYAVQRVRSTDLTHHGIKGQKWGKRNGPPYPLDSNDHSESEKKAGWRSSLNKGKGLTDKQKKILIASGIVAAAALGTYAAYRTGAVSKAAIALGRNKAFSNSELNAMGIKTADIDRIKIDQADIFFSNLKGMAPTKSSIEESASRIAKSSAGFEDDCQAGTLAQFLTNATGQQYVINPDYIPDEDTSTKIFKCFKGKIPLKCEASYDGIVNSIKDDANSMGAIVLNFDDDGHTFFYSVDSLGNVVLSDHHLVTIKKLKTPIYDKNTLDSALEKKNILQCHAVRLDDCVYNIDDLLSIGCVVKA